jgi:hypothetical protein
MAWTARRKYKSLADFDRDVLSRELPRGIPEDPDAVYGHLPMYESLAVFCHVESKGSFYERRIDAALRRMKVDFRKEYPLPCVGVGGRNLRADFAVFKGGQLLAVIEYHGNHHIREVMFYGGPHKQRAIRDNDARKASWCLDHGVMLCALNQRCPDGVIQELLAFLSGLGLVESGCVVWDGMQRVLSNAKASGVCDMKSYRNWVWKSPSALLAPIKPKRAYGDDAVRSFEGSLALQATVETDAAPVRINLREVRRQRLGY